LEEKPLFVKTDSTVGSNDLLRVFVLGKSGKMLSGVWLQFSSPTIQYNIGYCQGWIDLPVQAPTDQHKVWRFAKTSTSLSIACNAVEVLVYIFSNSTGNTCQSKWEGDVVASIMFAGPTTIQSGSIDTASDYYGSIWIGKLITVGYIIDTHQYFLNHHTTPLHISRSID
jgi:hypothetical protein